jgi:ClpP class serine protease
MAQRRSILSRLEQERGTKAITLIHRVEPWDEEERYITIEDSEFVLAQIRHTSRDTPIDLIVHTPGGLALAAEMIAMALRDHPAKVTAIIPFYAMSGGTLIALAADEILMERYATLGPVDPQIMGYPAAALLRVLAQKPIAAVSDETIVRAEVAKLAVQTVRRFVRWLLEDRLPEQQAEELAEFLTGGYLAHDTPITLDAIAGFGLTVAEGVPPLVYDLFSTCAFGVCRRPCLATYDQALEGSAPQPVRAGAHI